jgi:hypothetical protein
MDSLLRLRVLIPLFLLFIVFEQLPGGLSLTLLVPYVAFLVVIVVILAVRLAKSAVHFLRRSRASPAALGAARELSAAARPLLAVIGILVVAWLLPDRAFVKFDRHAWRAEDSTTVNWPSAYSVRERMVNDLVNHVLPGRTVQEVEAILGPSEAGSKEPPLYYRLCPHPFMDNVVLVLLFDDHGRFYKHGFGND